MKKAQIKMAENIGILVIFFFLLVIGLLFYSRIQRQSISYEAERLVGIDAVQRAHTIAALPEIQCSTPLDSETGKQDCVDKYKVLAFGALNDSLDPDEVTLFYYDILGDSRVTLRQIYPESDQEWVVYDNKPPNYTSLIPAHVPVFVYDELENRPLGAYYLGDLFIEVYR